MTQSSAPSIYHYTSIQSLAYILKSRALRFTRLDQFDDVQESQTVADWNFGAMLFASCWLAESKEDYPQWGMYAESMRGVRISMPRDPFDWYPYELEGAYINRAYTPVRPDRIRGQDYLVVADIEARDAFLRRVEYVDDINHHWREHCHVEGSDLVVRGGLHKLASVKSRGWEFQKEHRFVLQIVGRVPSASNSLQGPQITYFDVELNEKVFDQLIIRMGPLSSEADRIIVRSLMQTLAPNAKLEDSHLRGLVRTRNR